MTDEAKGQIRLTWKAALGVLGFVLTLASMAVTAAVVLTRSDSQAAASTAATAVAIQQIRADVTSMRAELSDLARRAEAFKATKGRVEENRALIAEVRTEVQTAVRDLREDLKAMRGDIADRASDRYTSRDAADDRTRLNGRLAEMVRRIEVLEQAKRR